MYDYTGFAMSKIEFVRERGDNDSLPHDIRVKVQNMVN